MSVGIESMYTFCVKIALLFISASSWTCTISLSPGLPICDKPKTHAM